MVVYNPDEVERKLDGQCCYFYSGGRKVYEFEYNNKNKTREE